MSNIRRAVRAADDGAAITMLSTVEDLLSVSVAERNFNTWLFVGFGVAGVLVALVGIYGLVAFTVARRQREMGIRLALGATGPGLKMFIMASTMRWVVAGLLFGIGIALLLAQYLRPFVYQIAPNDPLTLVLLASGFLLIAATATYIPASQAARVDPTVALRSD
jgi:putative ABC transport system permease protein